MRSIFVAAFIMLMSCNRIEQAAPPASAESQRTPTSLVGSWRRVAPIRLAGEMLTLNADSTARGIILWDHTRDARATRWAIRYGSRDSLAARGDWRQGYRDGGDPECVLGTQSSGCISMPHLCLGAAKEQSCQVFVYVAPDSLLLPDGSRFVRQTPVPMVSLSQ